IQRDGEEGTSAAVAYDSRRLAGTDVVRDGVDPCSPSDHNGSLWRRRYGDVMTAVGKLLRALLH
ncbi:MAG TPA: hypothetical protein VHH53_02735, partial [Pseudonocardiaceae bacterium]|nr:hypothetical protein [Pseudonocardiaceae bacterium]